MIPDILHFVFGMAPDFGGKPFSLAHFLSVKSAVVLNKPLATYFHYQYEPEGDWWEKTKPLVKLNKIVAPDEIFGRPLYNFAHKTDVVRLQMLKQTGGIYFDIDTISVKPLTELLHQSFVIGQELKPAYVPKNWRQQLKFKIGWTKSNLNKNSGLCNAVLLAEKNNEIINLWLDEYKTFRSKGRDKYWNEHSVLVPQRLASLNAEKITQLDPYAFHFPLYDNNGLKLMFEEVNEFPDAYVHHLWESFSWEKYLSKLNIEDIMSRDSTYNLIARRYL